MSSSKASRGRRAIGARPSPTDGALRRPPPVPLTDEEAELLTIYRELDAAGRAWLQWAVLAELGQRADPGEDAREAGAGVGDV